MRRRHRVRTGEIPWPVAGRLRPDSTKARGGENADGAFVLIWVPGEPRVAACGERRTGDGEGASSPVPFRFGRIMVVREPGQ